MNTSNARAVRNRADYLTEMLTKACELGAKRGKQLRILSVACGPAEEVRRILEAKNVDVSNIHIDLIDQDLGALRAAQFQVKEAEHRFAKHLSIKYVHKAIKNIVMEGLDGEYDLIYSAGLFDYFSDAVARLAGTKLFEAVAPKGEMVIGNFTAADDVKIRMELVLDWNLVYRSKEDLLKLYSKISNQVQVDQELEGINLFVKVRK